MTTSTFPAFVDATKSALEARTPALTGVQVFSAPPGSSKTSEAIVFVDCEDDIEYGSLGGGQQKERYFVDGVIYIEKPGKGDTVAKEARDRAQALLTELQTELSDKTSDVYQVDGVYSARVARAHFRQGSNTEGRVCVVEFDLLVLATI